MYFSLDDANYWYEIHGDGIPVVMLHGFTGSTKTWWDFIQQQQTVNLQVILVDLPGHGRTKIETPRTMEECCRDLNRLFDYLELDAFHLVGYSMGGRTALSFACTYPNRLRSLILESASPGLAAKAERQSRVEKDELLAKRLEREGIQTFVDFWEDIPLFQSQKKLPIKVQQTIRRERLLQSASGLAVSLRYMGTGMQPSWWDQLSVLKMPICLLVGELDNKFININQKMQKFIVSCKLIICEDAGHAIHVEKPEKFGKLVTDFILSSE